MLHLLMFPDQECACFYFVSIPDQNIRDSVTWKLFDKWGPVYTTHFLLLSVFVASGLPIHIALFLYKTEGNILFSSFTLIHLLTNMEPKMSILSVHIAPVL